MKKPKQSIVPKKTLAEYHKQQDAILRLPISMAEKRQRLGALKQ